MNDDSSFNFEMQFHSHHNTHPNLLYGPHREQLNGVTNQPVWMKTHQVLRLVQLLVAEEEFQPLLVTNNISFL